jgi:hypothetical protein
VENIDCYHRKEDGSSIEYVKVPLCGDDLTVPTVRKFDSPVNRPADGSVSAVIRARKRYTNLMTIRDVEIPIPMRRYLKGCETAM